jgi:hypothetical protein
VKGFRATAVSLAVAFWLLPGTVSAESSLPPREAALEARVKALENRIMLLEKQLNGAGASVHGAPERRRKVQVARPTAKFPGEPAASGASPFLQPPAATPVAAVEAASTPTTPPPARSPAPQADKLPPEARAEDKPAGDRSEIPQEFFVFRENAVTLRANRSEAAAGLGYLRNVGVLQKDHALVADVSLRHGLFDWLEVFALVPAQFGERQTLFPGRVLARQTPGIGDIVLGGTGQLRGQSADWPGAALTATAILPTGQSPYQFGSGYLLGTNPTNPLEFRRSLGTWGFRSVLQMYKTVDPLVIFAGAGVEHRFPVRLAGHEVDVGTFLLYNAGFSLAFSEKTTLGLQFSGAVQPALRVDGRPITGTDQEPVLVRLVLIQRIAHDWWLEPSLAAGLTNEAPNAVISLGVRTRF